MMLHGPISRRSMLRASALSAAFAHVGFGGRVSAVEAAAATGADPWRGLKVGVASYTFRRKSLEETIASMQRLGLKYVSIKDFHMPRKSTREERQAAVRKFKDGGITPLSCGNITMDNTEASIRDAFEYARDAGLPTIVCSPHPDSMPILDRMVKEFDIRLAIHNHGPEDKRFPSPYDVWKAAESYDKRIGLCIDVGHTARAKVDPAESIRKCRERLYDVHLKDIHSTEPDGRNLEVGRGVLDIESILSALMEIRYSHLLAFEYEKDEMDPLPGLAESVGYTRAVVSMLPAKGS